MKALIWGTREVYLGLRFSHVQSVRPTWFEDIAAPKDTTPQPNQDPQGQQPQPLHGLKLVIKEEVLPMKDQPEFPSLELLAARGLLAPDTWKCKRAQVSLKATIDVPMLGTIMEQNGDGLLLMVLSDNVVFIEPRASKN